MVFESVVTDLLNRFLGDFVENLDANQLKIGIWGGDVVLHNLILRQTALNDLDLPIQTVYGRLEKLVLKIPWSNLYGASVEAKIEGLYLLVEPNSQVKYNEEKEIKRLFEEKKKAIEKYENAKKLEEEKDKPKADDSFIEKLVTQIIKNVQLTINDIHIRYEDKSETPFAMGITLHNLIVQTTDANWRATVVEEMANKIFKIISLDGLAVYWNCAAELYSSKAKTDYVHQFHTEIARKDALPSHYKYILGPINLEARLKMNPKPEKDLPAFIIPKIHSELVIDKIALGITKRQYKDIINFADTMALQSRGMTYRKYRPAVTGYKGNAKLWWAFAYSCILEEEVKRKKRNWDWNNMLSHRNLCKNYSEAYSYCIKNKKKPDAKLIEMENKLDVFNIVLIRQQIKIEVTRLDEDVAKKKATGWFGGWWSKTPSDSDKDIEGSSNILGKFQAAMTPDEKKKLFNAIDYQENSAPHALPETFVDNVLKFKLNNLMVKIVDDSQTKPDVLLAELKGVKFSIETRAAASAMKFNVNIENLSTLGVQQGDVMPYLINSTAEDYLVDLMFEINPIDKLCGQRLNMTINPLKVVFDAATVLKCIDVFNVPSSTSIEMLSELTAVKLNNIKEMSATGLQYQIDKHTLLDVNINIIAPYIIIPNGGIYTGGESVLIINLGQLKITSRPRQIPIHSLKDVEQRERAITEILDQCYDVFNLELSNVQVLLAQSDEDWNAIINDELAVSPLHILRPINIHISFHKCLISDDPKLPLIKINGTLPIININITDARLLLLLSLLTSIQSKMDKPEYTSHVSTDSKYRYSSTLMINYVETPKVLPVKPKPKKIDLSENVVQFTELLGKFVIKEILIDLSHQDILSDPIVKVASMHIRQCECELILQNLNLDVNLNLGSILFQRHNLEKTIDVISTPLMDENSAYLKIKFTQVNKLSPELHSKYNSCESTLSVEFAKLDIRLHLESMQYLLKFANDLQTQLVETYEPNVQMRHRLSTSSIKTRTSLMKLSKYGSRHLSQVIINKNQWENCNSCQCHIFYAIIGLILILFILLQLKRQNHAKTKMVVETIQFKLIAKIDEVFVLIERELLPVSSITIKNIHTDIIVKNTYTQVNVKLIELTILDLSPVNVHKKIISVASDEAFCLQLVMYNTDKNKTYIGNPEKMDMSIKVNVGHIRICFVNWYITNIMNFLNEFQRAQQAIQEASQAAAKAAKDNFQMVYEKASKISLEINIKAPDIIVPESSRSYNGFVIDLGYITISNKFQDLLIKNENNVCAVVDILALKLENLKIARILLDKADVLTIAHEIIMLKPVTCTIIVNRNLSSWYKAIPDIDVSGKLEHIELMLGQPDYKCIMRVLSGNLAEGGPVNVSEQTIKSVEPLEALERGGRIVDASDDPENPHTLFKWDFVMKAFTLNLFTVPGIDQYSMTATRIGLGTFSLEGLAISGRMMSNEAIMNSLLLLNCLLKDTRPGREDNLTVILSRKRDEQYENIDIHKDSTLGISRNMLDCTFQKKNSDTFIDVRIYSFFIIISMDYLMKLADFFTNVDEVKKPATLSQTKTSTIPETNIPDSMFTLTLRIEKPDIILVEHMESADTRAVILNTEITFKLRVSGEHQVVNGIIKNLEMFTCVYENSRRDATKKTLLLPVTLNIAGSSPEGKGLHVEVLITDVALSVSPSVIELVNLIMASLSKIRNEEANVIRLQEDFSNIWDIQPYNNEDHWFLKTAIAMEAINYVPRVAITGFGNKLSEKCIMTMPKFTITIEAGVGNKTLPMLLLESSFLAIINDWSSQMNIDANLTLQMAYYNSHLALWEPLIEPVEVAGNNGLKTVPWSLNFEFSMNDNNAITPEDMDQISTLDSDVNEIHLQPAAISIDITSKENLELTVTKTFLEVIDNLTKSFKTAMNLEDVKRDYEDESPYKVINNTGLTLNLILNVGLFKLTNKHSLSEVQLESGATAHLDITDMMMTNISMFTDTTQQISKDLLISLPGHPNVTLPLNRADTRSFPLGPYVLISSIIIEDGIIVVTLSSIIKVFNHFNLPIDMYFMKESGNELEFITSIQSRDVAHVPMKAVYSPTSELFFSVSGYSVTTTPFVWKDLLVNVSVTKNLHCTSKNTPDESFIIKVIGDLYQVYNEHTFKRTMASTVYRIHLRPAINLRNYLPYEIVMCIQDIGSEMTILPGDTAELPTVNPGKGHIIIRIPDYLEKEWVCRHEIQTNIPLFSVWTFESHDSEKKVSLDLGMHAANRHGTSLMCLYCPFWMLNKTGLQLAYRKSKKTEKHEASGSTLKNSDENLNIIPHPANFKGPILFSFNAKNFFGKKKATVRMDNGEWSDKFSIDVAGSSGVVVCKTNDLLYQIGVNNRLTYNGLTKQITFTPYFVIINNSSVSIECQELSRPADPWTLIEPKQCTSLWPASLQEDKLIKLRIDGTDEVTAPFLITESHTTLLKLRNKYGGINVDIQITEGAIYINLDCYEYGSAPVIIINHTRDTLNLWEKQAVQVRKLPPRNKMFYTWENPSGQRVLVWEGGYKKEMEDDLRKDGVGEYSVGENNLVYWCSFLDGMQRVLLFTNDEQVAEDAQSSKHFEVIQQEITIALHGVGLSLVNNVKHAEVMYISMTSSGIIWEASRSSKRYKQFNTRDNIAIENAYQTYLVQTQKVIKDGLSSKFLIDGKEYDFEALEMLKPNKKIRRKYQTALWVQLKTSNHQMQLHAKLNKLQIDNQLFECIFPVVLAPVPPPKSIAVGNAMRPFAELSIVQLLIKDSQIKQFKYFKILIQEFHVKVDLGFINAVMDVFQGTEFNDEEERENFLLDKKAVTEPLFEIVSTQSLQEMKSFYDLLHFSPLKIHVSFSMAGNNNQEIGNTPNFINVLLQGLGVTLTDLQDVVFKLAFFEREYTFLTQRQLISEATSHYVGQSIKQLYVLVLGLDVIGNPYGLVVGITQGVEDLFYEPFQGAIQGPGEFAEGVVLGVRSLFGHTVGGAAGAVSKITGAMGKGIAALTFDKEFQKKRREQYNKKATSVQEGFARGGKGLVMGVFDGVTGVFTKPISGAKEQGVEGFFKGLGKGAVGLVTRPTAGVIDFASSSLDTVKRVTELGTEEAHRTRNPRYVQADGYVRPYNDMLAFGNKLLCELEKGKYSTTDSYSTHFNIIDKKVVLLLTDKRLAYIEHNDLFGNWQIAWAYTWNELSNPPKDVQKGVQISITREKKKMFGSNELIKIVLIADANIRLMLITKINEHLHITEI